MYLNLLINLMIKFAFYGILIAVNVFRQNIKLTRAVLEREADSGKNSISQH